MLNVLELKFECKAIDKIGLDQFAGIAIRSMWLDHLNESGFNPFAEVAHVAGYAIAPPAPGQYQPGECFEFYLKLFGNMAEHKYMAGLAMVQASQTTGLHHNKFQVVNVVEMQHQSSAHAAPIRNQIGTHLEPDAQFRLNFLTPVRIGQDKKLVHQPDFSVLFARLIERIAALSKQYDGLELLDWNRRTELKKLADTVELVEDNTTWQDKFSYSSRRNKRIPVSGFTGEAVYEADGAVIAELMDWLQLGVLTGVGKNVVKGCGVFRFAKV